MPKFKIETQYDLIPPLQNVGIKTVFSHADLSGISASAKGLNVSHVIHKTYINVDEYGTEAAAASAFGGMGAHPNIEPLVFKVDKPFLFVIHDNKTNTIFFMGRVMDPR